MIELLPPGSWDDIATNERVDRLGMELRTEMAGLRTELKVEMAGLRTEVEARMRAVENGMVKVESTLSERMTRLEGSLTERSITLEAAMKIGHNELQRDMAKNVKTMIAANTATMLTLGAILVAALKL